MYVTGGDNLLDAEETDESDALDKAFDVRSGSRLGCRARVIAEGTVDVEIARESLEAYENEHPQDRGKYTKNGKHGT